MASTTRPRLGVSGCLLGQKVRYDGRDKQDYSLTATFSAHVELVPICPELEAGMGVPREPVRLVGEPANPRLIAQRSGTDWTERMQSFADQRIKSLFAHPLDGYIFKKDSPSCGMERVKVYHSNEIPTRNGRGLFASALMRQFPLLPVEEEGRLKNSTLRENFVDRVFAYHRWRQLNEERRAIGKLVEFHTRHKFLLLAHSERHCRELGLLVADAKRSPIAAVYEAYGQSFMHGLGIHATTKKHCNALDHMMGYFSQKLSGDERKELLELLTDFRRRLIPLVAPLTLLRHYVRKYRVGYLEKQIYLEPSPKELMLRNHV